MDDAQNLTIPKSCGATTRRGTPCRRAPSPNGRCRLHGGASTGPRTTQGKLAASHEKHGLYSKGLSSRELELIEAGAMTDPSLEGEVVLARLMLHRLLQLQSGENMPPDWWALLDRYLGRVGRLMEQQSRLTEVRELQARIDDLATQMNQRGGTDAW